MKLHLQYETLQILVLITESFSVCHNAQVWEHFELVQYCFLTNVLTIIYHLH